MCQKYLLFNVLSQTSRSSDYFLVAGNRRFCCGVISVIINNHDEMIINIMMRLCIKTKSIITKNDRQGSGGDKNLQNIYYLDETNIKQGGGGQFSSIHRRAAQAGSTLAQVMIVNISTKIIVQT